MELGKVQTTHWYKKLVIGFSICAFVLLALIIYYSLSKTIIAVTLLPKEKSATLTVALAKVPADQPTADTALPGLVLTAEASDSKTFQNQNTGEEQPAPATGVVTIYNNWSQVQPLAATTRLLTPDGVLFRIKNRVDVPAGGKLENVEVYADQPGATGNIGPCKFTIPGLWPGLQEKIYAESSTPMTGGLRSASVLVQSTINDAAKTLSGDLAEKARADLATSETVTSSGYSVPSQAMTVNITQQKSSAEADSEAGSFTLTMKVTVTALAFNEQQLRQKADIALQASLPQDEKTVTTSPGKLTYTVEELDQAAGTALLKVVVTEPTVPRLDNPIFNRDKLVNKDRQEINSYFSNFDTVQSVEVRFSPFWVTHAPKLKDHIEVKLIE